MSFATIGALALAVSAQSTPPTDLRLQDAAQAIAAGRLDQARAMIARAAAGGAGGSAIERLFADLAFAAGSNAEALARYQLLAGTPPNDPAICERAVIAALRIEAIKEASSMIDCATSSPHISWRSWNARGVLADARRDWAEADAAYEKAASLGPAEPDVINNQGWSSLLRGDWARARQCFERAAKLDPKSARIANNLELADGALAEQLPRRRPSESDRSWAERLNDAGVAAGLLGDKKRAIAAFTQALEASGNWYSRASNNLDVVKK